LRSDSANQKKGKGGQSPPNPDTNFTHEKKKKELIKGGERIAEKKGKAKRKGENWRR